MDRLRSESPTCIQGGQVARACTICSHPRVLEINEALVQREAYRRVSKRFGASESAMFRHQQQHLPATMIDAKDAVEVGQVDSLMEKVRQLELEARRLGKKAEDAGDFRGAMAAVRELVRIVELLAKLQGELREPSGMSVNVVYVNPPGLDTTERTRPTAVHGDLQESVKQAPPTDPSSIVNVSISAGQSHQGSLDPDVEDR